MPRAFVGLGSNLDDPAAQVRRALACLQPAVVACSPLYRSAPLGPPGQAHYCNAVCELEVRDSPEDLLARLRALETELGRSRPRLRWAARRIDLDLVHYAGELRQGAELTLPHPEAHRRNFVLVPLADIAPELVLPGHGRVADLAAAIGRDGLEPWPI